MTERDEAGTDPAEPRTDPSAESPRFGRLLAIIIASFVVSGVLVGPVSVLIVVILNALLVVVAFRTTGLRTDMPRLWAIATIALVAIVLTVLIRAGSTWNAVPAFAQFLLLSILVLALIRAILQRQTVDIQIIVGSISAYLLVGLAYSWLYLGMDIIDESQISMLATETNEFPDFSFVVLTTLGFGNQLPTAPLASRIVVTEALIGQIFLVTFIARLVALYGQHSNENKPSTKRSE